jgi:predicted O-methyltransferase YrrM
MGAPTAKNASVVIKSMDAKIEDVIPADLAIMDLPQALLEAFHKRTVFSEQVGDMPLNSNISIPETLTLYRLLRHLKPSFSAEVGFAQGISTVAILKALSDNNAGLHHVMDPFQADYGDAGLSIVAKAGLDSRMQFHRNFAEEVIPGLPILQFGFIDSSHLFDLTICEFVMMDRKLEVGGMIAFHDMWMPSLQKFLRYVLANRSYEQFRISDAPSPPQKISAEEAT